MFIVSRDITTFVEIMNFTCHILQLDLETAIVISRASSQASMEAGRAWKVYFAQGVLHKCNGAGVILDILYDAVLWKSPELGKRVNP